MIIAEVIQGHGENNFLLPPSLPSDVDSGLQSVCASVTITGLNARMTGDQKTTKAEAV
jgi:hypothetical protein